MGFGQLLGSTLGTVFGGPTGSGIGSALGAGLDTNEAEAYNSAQAGASRDWSERMSSTTYQRTMKDMLQAGLNPMLAYSNGGSSVPTGASASFATSIDPSGSYVTSSRQAAAAESQAESASRNADSSQIQAISAFKNANTIAAKAEWEIKLTQINTDKVLSEIRNIDTDTEKVRRMSEMLYQQSELMKSQNINEKERLSVLQRTAEKLKTEIDLNTLDIDAALKFDNFGREAAQYKPLLDLLKFVFRGRK